MRLEFGLLAGLLACGGDALEGGDDFMDEPVPPKSCDTTPAMDTGCMMEPPIPTGSCLTTDECAGGFCVAAFDGDIGPFECRASCIDNDDETSWCLDAAACCDPEATCSSRGYCRSTAASDAGSGSESDTGSGSGTGSTGSTSTGGGQ